MEKITNNVKLFEDFWPFKSNTDKKHFEYTQELISIKTFEQMAGGGGSGDVVACSCGKKKKKKNKKNKLTPDKWMKWENDYIT